MIAVIIFTVSALWLWQFAASNYLVEAPKKGGTYREGIVGELQIPNPIWAQSGPDQDISAIIYEGLTGQDEKGEIVTRLAESYEINDEGKTYLFTLRENLLWSDGKPLSAEDVVFTVKMLQDPRTKSPFRSYWQGIEITYIDERRVKFTLREAYTPFLENLMIGIVPKHIWEEIPPQNIILADTNFKPVGSGPFILNETTKTQTGTIETAALKRNPYYNDREPYLNAIEFRFYPTEEKMFQSWRKDELDGMANLDPATASQIAQNREATLKILPLPRITSVFFNQTKSKALSSLLVRKALELALPKDKIIQESLAGFGQIANSPLPEISQGHAHQEAAGPSIEQAKALLVQDGWKDEDADGILEKSISKKENIRLGVTLVTSQKPELAKTAEIIARNWSELGAEIHIEKLEVANLSENYLRPRNYDALLFGQVYSLVPDAYPYWHSSQKRDPGLNLSLYDNPEADKIIDRMRKAASTAEQEELALTFQQFIQSDTPAIFLYQQPFLWVTPTNLKGINIEKIASPSRRFTNISDWHVKTKRTWKK